MKKLTKPALWVLAISLAALFSCNDPSAIGSDLLSGEDLDTDFTDTLTLKARTVTSDSIRVWDSSASGVDFQNFAFGDFQDPIFGRSVSSIYAQMLPSNNKPDFGGSTTASLDSVVIMLAYNPALCYGKLDELFTMELYEMDQSLDNDEVYYNTDSFAVKAVPFATTIFVPNIEDSLTIFSARADTVYEQILPAHLRITLAGDDPFALSLFNADTSVLNNDSVFLESFRGFWLKPASTNAGMLSFAMRSLNTNMRFYYHEADSIRQYDFRSFSSNPVTMHQRNYYGGSIAGQHISQDGDGRNDSLLFMQGLNGLNIEFEIPNPESLNGIIINKAELILPILSLPDDTDDYEPVEQIYVTEVLTDTSLADIEDIILARNRFGTDFGDYFGGRVTSEDTYEINLSAHFQRMIAGEVGKKLLFTSFFKGERAARVVLGGPTHSTSPAKLKITYTRY